jgi:hypothetical protein
MAIKLMARLAPIARGSRVPSRDCQLAAAQLQQCAVSAAAEAAAAAAAKSML